MQVVYIYIVARTSSTFVRLHNLHSIQLSRVKGHDYAHALHQSTINTLTFGMDTDFLIVVLELTSCLNPKPSLTLPRLFLSTIPLETDRALDAFVDANVVELEKCEMSISKCGSRYLFTAEEGRPDIENAVDEDVAEMGRSDAGARCLETRKLAVPGDRCGLLSKSFRARFSSCPSEYKPS